MLNIYDLSRFEIVEAVRRLNVLCCTYNQMSNDPYLDDENEKLKTELKEVIPLLKEDIKARISNL